MANLQKRLERLEQRMGSPEPGSFVIEYVDDWRADHPEVILRRVIVPGQPDDNFGHDFGPIETPIESQ